MGESASSTATSGYESSGPARTLAVSVVRAFSAKAAQEIESASAPTATRNCLEAMRAPSKQSPIEDVTSSPHDGSHVATAKRQRPADRWPAGRRARCAGGPQLPERPEGPERPRAEG